jgi:hypothetical protein
VQASKSSKILLLAAAALFVDMFLQWGRDSDGFANNFTGWDTTLTAWAGVLALAVVLVESVRWRGVWWTWTSSLLGFFLGAACGILMIAGLIHMHWGSFIIKLKFSEFGYGAWAALVLAVILLMGAWMRLEEHRAGRAA